MSAAMQLAVALSYGSLMWGLAWRFTRSEWANMPIVDILHHRSVQEVLAREFAKHLEFKRRNDELLAVLMRDSERLRLRMDLERKLGMFR